MKKMTKQFYWLCFFILVIWAMLVCFFTEGNIFLFFIFGYIPYAIYLHITYKLITNGHLNICDETTGDDEK